MIPPCTDIERERAIHDAAEERANLYRTRPAMHDWLMGMRDPIAQRMRVILRLRMGIDRAWMREAADGAVRP